jgi:hypothetical protein
LANRISPQSYKKSYIYANFSSQNAKNVPIAFFRLSIKHDFLYRILASNHIYSGAIERNIDIIVHHTCVDY